MSETVEKEELEKLFMEFMACPDNVYPWNIYAEWKKICGEYQSYDSPKWQDLIYNRNICSAVGDTAKKNEFDEETIKSLKNYANNPNDENFKKIEEKLNVAFNQGKKGAPTNFTAKINKMAAVFDKESAFIPSENKFNDCCEWLEKKFKLKVEGDCWLKKNKNLNKLLKENISLSMPGDNLQKSVCKKDNDFVFKAFPTWVQFSKDRVFPTESNPNVIFYGAPGTGKTYYVRQYLKIKFPDEEEFNKHVKWVQFHPSYSYEDFIEGIKPIGIKHDSVELKLVNGQFKDFCIKAKENRSEEYYFVADEINRANLSAVFGETLSLLESGYRDFRKNENENEERNMIETQYSELEKKLSDEEKRDICYDYNNGNTAGKFGIPANIRFIGMMNDVDKSIDSFDLALRRRFKWIRMDCDYNVIRNNIEKNDVESYVKRCARLNYFISGRDPKSYKGLENCNEIIVDKNNSLKLGSSYEFGHSNFLKIKEICAQNQIQKDDLDELFVLFLQPTLKEYLRSFFSEDVVESKLGDAKGVFLGKEKIAKPQEKGNDGETQPEKEE
jgi:hypothetical protein